MIIRLSLKTEHPERILSFLETYDYLRVLPIRLEEKETGEVVRSEPEVPGAAPPAGNKDHKRASDGAKTIDSRRKSMVL